MSDNCPYSLRISRVPDDRPRARCQSCDRWFYEDTLCHMTLRSFRWPILLCRACLNEGLQGIKGIRCQPIS